MKLGVHIGYWGLGLSSDDQREIVQEAERLGYDSVWAAEAYGSDAATILGWLAGLTSTIKLGSAIFQMPARSPAMTAMTAATIDQLSGGRMLLGIGSSGPQVAEGWHGQRFARQIQRTREYVAVVRKALARERARLRRRDADAAAARRPGQGAEAHDRARAGADPDLPRGDRARTTRAWPARSPTAGSRRCSRPSTSRSSARCSRRAPRAAGRSLEDFDVAPQVNVFVTDDIAAARDAMRPFIALYVGGMGSREKNFYNALVQRYGFEDEARDVQDLYLDGKRNEAMARLSDELIDTVSLCGPPDHVRERLAVYRDAGVGTLGVSPLAFTKGDRLEQLRLIAELAA